MRTLRLAVGAVRYDEDTAFGCWTLRLAVGAVR